VRAPYPSDQPTICRPASAPVAGPIKRVPPDAAFDAQCPSRKPCNFTTPQDVAFYAQRRSRTPCKPHKDRPCPKAILLAPHSVVADPCTTPRDRRKLDHLHTLPAPSFPDTVSGSREGKGSVSELHKHNLINLAVHLQASDDHPSFRHRAIARSLGPNPCSRQKDG